MSYSLVIDALAKRGNFCDALETEHELIRLLLKTLNRALATGADQPSIVFLIDTLDEECRSHFINEERYLIESGATDIASHVLSHRHLTERTVQVLSSIVAKDPSGILDAVDLLHCIQDHIAHVDQPAYTRLEPVHDLAIVA